MKAATEEYGLLRTFWNALSFSEIRTAMRIVIRHMFVKPVTFQYPREKRTIPDAHRGALGLLRYDDGEELGMQQHKEPGDMTEEQEQRDAALYGVSQRHGQHPGDDADQGEVRKEHLDHV